MLWYNSPTSSQHTFARVVRRQWLIAVPFAAGLLLAPVCLETLRSGIHRRIGPLPVASWCLILIAAEGILFGLALWNWRCPACRCVLPMKSHPRACTRCGAALSREEQPSATDNPFWSLLHLSLKALRVAHEVLHGFVFMALGACLGGMAGVWIGDHLAPRTIIPLMVGGAVVGLIAGGLIALSALRRR